MGGEHVDLLAGVVVAGEVLGLSALGCLAVTGFKTWALQAVWRVLQNV